jgi:hypothetical protein
MYKYISQFGVEINKDSKNVKLILSISSVFSGGPWSQPSPDEKKMQ